MTPSQRCSRVARPAGAPLLILALACGGEPSSAPSEVATPANPPALQPAPADVPPAGSGTAPVGGGSSSEGGPGNGIALDPALPAAMPGADQLFVNLTVAELARVRTVQEVKWTQST